MIYKEHFLELFINGQKAELESQRSLNLRFQNVLFNPEKISSTQAEYSFEFELPSTPKNDKIFDYANNLSKLNKFRRRLNAEVYADGILIFEGTIVINGYKEKKYSCNLVSVKTYSLEDIFGDKTMNQIKWEIPFEGATDRQYSMDYYNGMVDSDVKFPIVSYGAFPKDPYFKDDSGGDYTPLHDLDKWNKWYIETFYPSPKLTTTLKKAFETAGYSVGGDIFNNPYLSNIYMSTNLADGQDPQYNVGNPKFGKIDLSVSWTTKDDIPPSAGDSGKTYGITQELKFPYFRVGNDENVNKNENSEYNFKNVRLYNMLEEGNVTVNQPVSYMYQPNENLIVIPATGFYKVNMQVTGGLNTTSSFHASHFVKNEASEIEEQDIELTPNFNEICPLEIQLVRNYDENLELIKGKWNRYYRDGNPNNATYLGGQNARDYLTCFPHEAPKSVSPLPTKMNDLTRNWTPYLTGDWGDYYNDGEIMCYDQSVSPGFICGFSSMGKSDSNGVVAAMKNGYSWSKMTSSENHSLYNQQGYSYYIAVWGEVGYEYQGELNKNTYPNAPTSTISTTSNSMQGSISTLVWLEKNDILRLYAVHRDYNTIDLESVSYKTNANVTLSIEAATPKIYSKVVKSGYGYTSPVEFNDKLEIPNFFNSDTKISDWITNVKNAFNLDIIQNGNTVEINTHKKLENGIISAVELDNRVNSSEAEVGMINYPRSMAVKYKTDKDEWGFERSAVEAAGGDESVLDEEDWEKYADSGYTVIELNDDSYVSSTSDISLQFSYTWYDNFNWYAVNADNEQSTSPPITLRIPTISKYSYMIDAGHNYDELEKHDGYGLAQRFWFAPNQTPMYVYVDTYPAERVTLYEPTNLYTNYRDINFNLSYKTSENSILTEFFNYMPYLASNYVEVDAYITADEYNRLKNGALIHFDSDIYYPVEISGYDATGVNPTTIKMMKKI